MIKKSSLSHAIVLLICTITIGWAATAAASDVETEKTYNRKFRALAADDLDGHLKLADWCRQQEAWELLLKQCNHILSLPGNAKHRKATLLRKLAQSKLPSTTPPPTDSPEQTEDSSKPPQQTSNKPAPISTTLLTNEQIQILRRLEFKLNKPERVQIRFNNDVINRFWDYRTARENLQKDDRKAFNKLNPVQKAQEMLKVIRDYERANTEANPFEDTYTKDIELASDPEAFKTYKSMVWPIVKSACSSTGCHGGHDRASFDLYNDRVMSDNKHYTNFLILSNFGRPAHKLIDRDYPEKSLILQYGMADSTDPTAIHPTNLSPVFRNTSDVKYKRILDWITNLELPAPDYGIVVEKSQ